MQIDTLLQKSGPSDSRALEAEAAMLGLSEAGHFDLTLMLDVKVRPFSCQILPRVLHWLEGLVGKLCIAAMRSISFGTLRARCHNEICSSKCAFGSYCN